MARVAAIAHRRIRVVRLLGSRDATAVFVWEIDDSAACAISMRQTTADPYFFERESAIQLPFPSIEPQTEA